MIVPDRYATDRARELAREGFPFRDALRRAAAEMHDLKDRSPEQSLVARVGLGGAGSLGLDRLHARPRALQIRAPWRE